MFEKICFRSLATFAAAVLLVSTASAVEIETVPVGNLGNLDDTHGDGYGAVDYAYNIGKYEVTAGQYCEFLNTVDPDGSDPYGLYDDSMDTSQYGCQITWNGSGYDFSGGTEGSATGAAAEWQGRPVNYVSWGDAARFCNWLHNGQPVGQLTGVPANDLGSTEDGAYALNGAVTGDELLAVTRAVDWTWAIPTEDEWYKAAYHKNDGDTGNYFDYPTSSNTVPGYVNNSGTLSGTGNPFVEGGTDPGNYATYNSDGGTYGIGPDYFRTEVGEWENSVGPYQTFDQGGNVWEWNEAILHGSYRGLRGSALGDRGNLHASSRNYGDPTGGARHGLGFRVASIPEPACITLLLCGVVAGLVCRRRWR